MEKNINSHIKEGKAYKTALGAMMTAIALIFSYIEVLIPFNFGFPGIKLGLSNLIVIIALYRLGTGYAFLVNTARILLSGLLFGGVSAMLYSLAGGMLSFAVMFILKKTKMFSPIGVSMAGGVFHNIGQLTLAALITETGKIFLYMPILMISGTITGVLIGIAAVYILKKIR
ncbi:MAG: Gx transporter family protein [Anaerovoracaceae bacterium]